MTAFVCTLPLLSALFTACAPVPPFASGYVEGEYVLIAPVATAEIREIAVARGDRVAPGDPLVRLEDRDATIALAQAEAGLQQAEAALADLREGARPEEIAAIEAELAAARLPARPQRIAAAEAALDGARAARDQAEWNLARRRLEAPAGGTVSDLIRTPGELAGPAAPVMSLLPDDGVKLRLYVPQDALPRIAPGSLLDVRCDGCPPGLQATVSYVADTPEFTPPVIYSIETRQKLVYLIEARPAAGAGVLKPGQIVDVVLPGAAE